MFAVWAILVLIQESRQTAVSMEEEIEMLKYRLAGLEKALYAVMTDRSSFPMMTSTSKIRSPRMKEAVNQLGLEEMEEGELGIYLPLLFEQRERTMLLGESEERDLMVGERIFVSSKSLVFNILNLPGTLIKYQVSCDGDRQDVHELVRDYALMRLVASLGSGIVPVIRKLSLQVLLPNRVSTKTKFSMTIGNRMNCVLNNGTLRYMIMENRGTSLTRLVQDRGPMHPALALQIMAEIISHLRQVHGLNIAHGDIHPGNVLVDESTGRVSLTDFGRGMMDDEISDTAVNKPFLNNFCMYSPYEILGFLPAYRDDVFRAVMVGAFMLAGRGWTVHCNELEKDANKMMDFKAVSFFFEIPDKFSLNSIIPSHQLSTVRRHLQVVLEKIRSVGTPRTRPDYDAILYSIEQARSVVDLKT